jgi:hypothetical protein
MPGAYKRARYPTYPLTPTNSPLFLSFFFDIASHRFFYKFPGSSVLVMASSTKANMNSVYSILTENDLKSLSAKYDLLPEYGAEIPAPNKTALQPPPGKITVYAHFFMTSHLGS